MRELKIDLKTKISVTDDKRYCSTQCNYLRVADYSCILFGVILSQVFSGKLRRCQACKTMAK
jgi:hypothetical protein